MPLLVFYHILQPLRHAGDTACRPTDDPFSAFLSPGAQEPVQRQNNICLVQVAEKKIYFGHSSKKDNHPGPFSQQGFAVLYKSETSWELLGRLSRSFFSANSGASNFKHSLFMTPFWTQLANYVRASSSSLLFCIQPSLKLFQLLYSGLLVFPFVSCLQNLHFSMIILPPNIRIFPVFQQFLQQISQ